MTYLEKAVEEYKKKIFKFSCPYGILGNGIAEDYATEKVDADGNVVGCRGIKCEECWNKEMEEE